MAYSPWNLPELVAYQTGRGLVRIPCEQDVPFTDRVRAIVDTEEFQRLQHISQLGLVQRVYPGATHTRFEHALGVYHNALRYLSPLSQNSRFTEICDQREAELFLVSALLHDLGHWPFCHPIEDMAIKSIPDHEEFAREYLLGSTELNHVLKTVWQIDPHDVCDILVPLKDDPSRKLLRTILSGPIDIDKMDYLDRDSLHAGVPYGRNFDRNRLINSLTINEAGDGLAITTKGKTAAELMVVARYVMFSEVYWHHAVRSATAMFSRAFYELHENLDSASFFRGRESDSIALLRKAAQGTGSEILTEGLFGNKRNLFKRISEYTAVEQSEIYHRLAYRPYHETVQIARILQQELISEISTAKSSTEPIQILIDSPPPRREVEFKVDIYDPQENCYRPLKQVSPIVEALAQRQFDDYVKKVRLFASRDLAEKIPTRRLEELILKITEQK